MNLEYIPFCCFFPFFYKYSPGVRMESCLLHSLDGPHDAVFVAISSTAESWPHIGTKYVHRGFFGCTVPIWNVFIIYTGFRIQSQSGNYQRCEFYKIFYSIKLVLLIKRLWSGTWHESDGNM